MTNSPLLSRAAAAEYLGVKSQTLALWASSGKYGLPYIKVGGLAMYRIADLERWLEARSVTSSIQAKRLGREGKP